VTNAIQTLRHLDPAFDDWWKPYQDKMASDPLMKCFNATRTNVILEGELHTTNYTVVGSEGPVDVAKLAHELGQHAPPGTVATFFGDELGGDGWDVLMPDGTTQAVYFQLSEGTDLKSGLRLANPPTEHYGQPITDTSTANLGNLYMATVSGIVDDFIARFSEEPLPDP
jgi:hypothetical protein